MSKSDARRYDSIDALRAIAVSAVIASHFLGRFPAEYLHYDANTTFPRFGGIGVYLFFVISGYCIAMTAERSSNIGLFWLKRFTRLQPAFMACIAVTMITVAALGLPGREVSITDALRNAIWYPLFGQTRFVDGAYWSLMEEAKFYAVFAVIYYLAPRQSVVIFAAYTTIGATAFFTNAWPDHQALIYPYDGIAGPYFLFPSSLFFLMGIAAYKSSKTFQILTVAACVATIIAVWGRSEYAFCIAAISTLGMIGAQASRLRIWRPITFVGLISYPLYLIHQNVGIAIIRALYPLVENQYARIAVAVVLVLGLAALISWSVEHRFRSRIERFVVALAKRFLIRGHLAPSQDTRPFLSVSVDQQQPRPQGPV